MIWINFKRWRFISGKRFDYRRLHYRGCRWTPFIEIIKKPKPNMIRQLLRDWDRMPLHHRQRVEKIVKELIK